MAGCGLRPQTRGHREYRLVFRNARGRQKRLGQVGNPFGGCRFSMGRLREAGQYPPRNTDSKAQDNPAQHDSEVPEHFEFLSVTTIRRPASGGRMSGSLGGAGLSEVSRVTVLSSHFSSVLIIMYHDMVTHVQYFCKVQGKKMRKKLAYVYARASSIVSSGKGAISRRPPLLRWGPGRQ